MSLQPEDQFKGQQVSVNVTRQIDANKQIVLCLATGSLHKFHLCRLIDSVASKVTD